MSNLRTNLKSFAVLIVVFALLICLLACGIDISQGIIGKWYCVDDSSVMEVKSNGELAFTSYQGNSGSGEYTFKDKLLYFQTGAASSDLFLYGNGIYNASLSNNELTLDPVDAGESIKFIRYGILDKRIIGNWRFKEGGEGFFEYSDNEEPPTGIELEFSDDNSFTCTAENFEQTGNGRFAFEDNKTIVIMYRSNNNRVLIYKFQIYQVDDNKLVLEERGFKMELDKQ